MKRHTMLPNCFHDVLSHMYSWMFNIEIGKKIPLRRTYWGWGWGRGEGGVDLAVQFLRGEEICKQLAMTCPQTVAVRQYIDIICSVTHRQTNCFSIYSLSGLRFCIGIRGWTADCGSACFLSTAIGNRTNVTHSDKRLLKSSPQWGTADWN